MWAVSVKLANTELKRCEQRNEQTHQEMKEITNTTRGLLKFTNIQLVICQYVIIIKIPCNNISSYFFLWNTQTIINHVYGVQKW